jgi:hypothetical protein
MVLPLDQLYHTFLDLSNTGWTSSLRFWRRSLLTPGAEIRPPSAHRRALNGRRAAGAGLVHVSEHPKILLLLIFENDLWVQMGYLREDEGKYRVEAV